MATLVDFVGGGNGVFYALDANTGAIIWQTSLRTQPNDFLWSSPLFYNGSIYEGVAALTDCPTVQGELVQMDATSGAIQNTFDVVPNGCTGGGVWGSPVVNIATGTLFFATGNPTGKKCSLMEPYAPALVQLNASNLSFVNAWQVPSSQQTSDSDFGSTPTLFQVTVNGVKQEFIGVGNKNGIFYTFNRANISVGPIWQDQIAIGGGGPVQGQGVISPSAWNGSSLFVAGGNTTINGNSCQGSLQALDPTTGAFLWQDCLSSPIIGAVSGVPGVIVGDSLHAMVVVSAKTGSTFFTYQPAHGQFWSGASISNGVLYVTNSNHNLYAFGL